MNILNDCVHLVATCKSCGSVYDVDFEPPLFCHDDDQWDINVEERSRCRTHGTLDKPV